MAENSWSYVTGSFQDLQLEQSRRARHRGADRCVFHLVPRWVEVVVKRGWSWVMGHFRVHTWDWILWACYTGHGQAWLLTGSLADSADGRTKVKWDCKSPQGCFLVVARTTVGKSVIWAWVCLFKMALLGFGLHQGFMVSYLDRKAPTMALLSLDGFQMTVLKRDTIGGSSTLPSCWCHYYLIIFNSFILKYDSHLSYRLNFRSYYKHGFLSLHRSLVYAHKHIVERQGI